MVLSLTETCYSPRRAVISVICVLLWQEELPRGRMKAAAVQVSATRGI